MQIRFLSGFFSSYTSVTILIILGLADAHIAVGQQLAYTCMAGYNTTSVTDYLSFDTGKDMELSDVYMNAGIQKDNDEDFEGAINDYTRAIELKPDCAEAYDKRGMAYVKTFKFEKAIRDFNKAIKIQPVYAEAFNHRGVANYCIREYGLALRDYTLAIQADPEYAKAYYNRGLLGLEIDEKEAAFADLRAAMKLNHPDAARLIQEYFQ
jgi:tetratricopeptide (TPR) repeat protein